MQPNQILRKARRDHDHSLSQVGDLLGTTGQRVSQWEGGQTIPEERAFAWAMDPELPDWVRVMAREIVIAQIRLAHDDLGTRIARLTEVLADI